MKMSKTEKKELIVRLLVIGIASALVIVALVVYPELSFVLPLGWLVTGLGMMLVYGPTDGIIYCLQWSGHLMGMLKDYLVDTYKLFKLL